SAAVLLGSATSSPPLAPVVLVEPRGQERGAGHQVGQLDQLVDPPVEVRQLLPLGPEEFAVGVSRSAVDRAEPGRRCASRPRPAPGPPPRLAPLSPLGRAQAPPALPPPTFVPPPRPPSSGGGQAPPRHAPPVPPRRCSRRSVCPRHSTGRAAAGPGAGGHGPA